MRLKGPFEMIKVEKRQSIIFVIKIAVTLLILWMLAHYSQLKLELVTSIFVKPLNALFAISLFYLSVLANSWRWYRLNSAQAINLSFRQSILPTYVGIAYNNILPGSVGGDFIRCFYVMKKFPEKKSGAALSIFLDRVCGLMGIIIIAFGIALFRLDTFSQNRSLFYIFIVCASVCSVGLILFFLSQFLPEKMGLIDFLKERTQHWRWFQPIISIFEALSVYRQSKLIIFECLVLSVVNQLILLVIILLINNMMGLSEVSFLDYMIALAIAQIANLIPLTPGGVGIGEAAFANIILILNPGVTGAYATVFFVYRILMTAAYLPGILAGIFGLKLANNIKEC